MPEWVSLLPFLTAIALAMALEEIILGLVVGLLLGAFLLEPAVLGGANQVVDAVLAVLAKPVNIEIAGFLYLFGGLVGMMQIAGGVRGLVNYLRPRLRTARSALAATWLTLLITFLTPTFRIITVGPILRDIKDRLQLPGLFAGYILDVSSVPTVVLLPAGTAFAGYMVALIDAALRDAGLQLDSYGVFLGSLPFNFFAWIIIAMGLYASLKGGKAETPAPSAGRGSERFLDRYEGRMEVATRRRSSELHRIGIKHELSQVQPRPLNLVLVLLMLLALISWFMYLDGVSEGGTTWLDILLRADAVRVLLLSVMFATVLAFPFYLLRGVAFHELVYHFFDGANQLTRVIVLLVLVWSLSGVSQRLGLNQFVVGHLSFAPAPLIPVTFFLGGSLLAYFIGSSWGTWGLLMPLGVSLAAATGGPLIATVGAVFASGTFGSFASPLGDTTVTTSALLDLKPTRHARNKLGLSIPALVLSAVLYVAAGYLG